MKSDYEIINSEFDKMCWDTLLCEESIDNNWKLFKNIVLATSSKYTPKVTK